MQSTTAWLTFESEKFVKNQSPTGRLSKAALRKALRIKPHLEMYNGGHSGGTYVNGNDAARGGFNLMVRSNDQRVIIGFATFKVDADGNLQAVVR